ncbi:hypothetical protein SAMN05421856_111103 [Chryseobacterium taichungense]|uniref:Uncharacterized protein n=1 Tax=Chryseobacterium taichungense TaxID=295069 RepID=A0A1H8D3S4_9FLAO|nr:hypothetical protein SAMN05421856_111103 [Chryseobacterium taichungense]
MSAILHHIKAYLYDNVLIKDKPNDSRSAQPASEASMFNRSVRQR